MMKRLLLVVLLAAAATAAVVSNEVPEVVEVPERVEGDPVVDVDVNEMSIVFKTDVVELTDENELFEETAGATRSSLSLGTISHSDIPLNPVNLIVNPIPGAQASQQITIGTSRPITAIRVDPVAGSHSATPSLVSGGLGQLSATIRVVAALNRGFHYRIVIYRTN